MRTAGHLALIILLFAATLLFAWVGHIASDDVMYISTARDWFRSFPVLPASHWAERHPLTLATGAILAVFGDGEI